MDPPCSHWPVVKELHSHFNQTAAASAPMHKSCTAKEVCADLNSPCAATSSLYYRHKMVLVLSPTSAFQSFHYWWGVVCCTDVSPKPSQGYFSSDFFQQMFPGSQVYVLSPPLSRNSTMRLTYCSAAVSLSWRVCTVAHH